MTRAVTAAEIPHAQAEDASAPVQSTRASRNRTRTYGRGDWRVWLVRVPADGLAVGLTALILPGIHMTTSRPVLGYLLLGAIFGLLNTFVKPAIQYVALPFLLRSFGLVVVVVNIVVFWLLDLFFKQLLAVDGFWWYVAGGVLVGLLAFLIENLLGLTPPILDDRAERGWSS